MTKGERWEWILRRLMKPEQAERIDMLDAAALDAFEEETGAPARVMGLDLRNMHDQELVRRERKGVAGVAAKWVYSYSLGLRAGAFLASVRSAEHA